MAKRLSKRTLRGTALWAMVVLLVSGSAVPMSANGIGLVLGAQSFYQLIAKPLVDSAACGRTSA